MKWAAHLDGYDLVDQYDAGAALVLEAESFRREVGRCSLRVTKVPHETRRWLKSIDPAKPEGRPFALEQQADTVWKYERGRGICFTDEQWTAMDAMAEALEAAGDATAETSGESARGGTRQWGSGRPAQSGAALPRPRGSPDDGYGSESDEYETGSDDDYDNGDDDSEDVRRGGLPGRRQEGRQSEGQLLEYSLALDRRVYDFCIASLKQKVAVNIFANLLIHFTAVLSILDLRKRAMVSVSAASGDGGGGQQRAGPGGLGWCLAAKFTLRLAGIIWCGRILMLEHFFEAQPIDGDPNEIGLELVEGFIEQYRRWLADGSHTPFSAIIRMMLYGKGH
ncbi:hypothetical protein LZ30DRAFT_755204 [Colletotrichum cereale]|nr:hypothetical protein LZ30DRAFT_755204 [Colletotrichum cereale]